jgi:hypothetical protein
MQRTLTILLIFTASFSSSLFAAQILTCKSPEGKTIYTDDARKCGAQKAAELHLDIPKDTRVNYRYPERQYDAVESRWPIFIERPERESDKKLYNKAVRRLEKTLDLAFTRFPQPSHEQLKTVTYYIMRGPKSSLGGEDSVLRYAPHGSTKRYSLHDRRWNNAVIIYNVDNYLWLTDTWNNKTITHELSHAWHFLKWGYQHQAITDVWLNSRSSGLYLSVKDNEGRLLKPAYASTNNMEYFAELSAIYFAGGVYYPFNKQGLKTYDPTGYAMVQKHWLITESESKEQLAGQ